MADSIVYPGLVHLNGCLMAAIDLETTGTRPGHHEIIQIAVVPLDSDFKPLADVRPFYTLVKPEHPERESRGRQAEAQDSDDGTPAARPGIGPSVADWLHDWFVALKLPFKKCLVPLAHNWAFESSFLKAWLGVEADGPDLPQPRPRRDALRDLAERQGRLRGRAGPVPTGRPRRHVQAKLGIVNTNPHDALADCLAEAEVYHTLLRMF